MLRIFSGHTKHRGIYIAEIGLNHNGSAKTAAEMIEAAASAGADAVKFQTIVPELLNSVYTASLLNNESDPRPDLGPIEFFRRFMLSFDEYHSLKALAEKSGMLFFSSPFDASSLETLQALDVPLYKIASSEITNIPFIKKIAKTGKSAIMSTGISLADEIALAVNSFVSAGGGELALMHCVSNYPPAPENINLSRIASLRREFGLETGFSDHSRGWKATVLSAAFGAEIFEKHFTIDKNYDCPDKDVSLAPDEFRSMIGDVEEAILMLGSGHIDYGESEASVAKVARRSLFACRDILPGSVVTEDDIVALRPGVGIPPYSISEITGRRAKLNISKDSILYMDYFE
ncbi:MAG: N-acetylneuraminate synthase family protein [Spirochaetia bacterium]|jgi:sialic acid synthase SpsE|nr:N-acetylneuraminate synthase family protein [Spirochaetia bacterium]